ncbi:hypothetical protein BH10ACI1_BH10ACI1_33880 [soil metagenome]
MRKHARSKCADTFTHLLRACFCIKSSQTWNFFGGYGERNCMKIADLTILRVCDESVDF